MVDDSMRRDKAVCVWSHAIGCYVKVGQEGEWELVVVGGAAEAGAEMENATDRLKKKVVMVKKTLQEGEGPPRRAVP